MNPSIAKSYIQRLQRTNQEKGGWVSIPNRGFVRRCVIMEENDASYYIRYFEEDIFKFTYEWVDKNRVTVDDEVKELAFYVVKNKESGFYHTANNSASTAPQLYLTKGKAEGRRKQKVYPDNWVIMKWVISEREA